MVKVIKTGFYTTLQDLGRFDFQDYGVPVSGVMDQYSAKIANSLLGNEQNAAVLEITMTGPTLQFLKPTAICISGADISPTINEKLIKLNTVYSLKAMDVLSFGKLHHGFRSYLAVYKGFKTQSTLKSKSMYKPVTVNSTINIGEIIGISEFDETFPITNSHLKLNKHHFETQEIEVYEGPEFDMLNSNLKQALFLQSFTISKENNRMAYQLEDEFINNIEPIITSLVLPGTVQLTPAGKLIILMRDGQTTGGYPRVLQLKESSINRLSQKYTGNLIKFIKVK